MLTGALGLREGEGSVHVASTCDREHTCLGCVADAAALHCVSFVHRTRTPFSLHFCALPCSRHMSQC